MTRTVLVTGATGFIAQHVLDNLLKKGFTVIGTARSKAKYTPLLEEFSKKYPEGKLSFAIVPDISTPDAFDEVLKENSEIDAVLHTASPFSFGLSTSLEDGFLNPAVNGTVNVLNAIYKYAPQVTNVVITSSFAAIKRPGDKYTSVVHTSETWNPVKWEEVTTELEAYPASKTYAEKAAREFVEKNKPNFKLATVNPPYVFGPQTFDRFVGPVLNTSNEILNTISKVDPTTTEPVKILTALAVDVRDVAEFHVRPLEDPRLESERLFIVSEPVTGQSILNILNDKVPQFKGKIAKGDPSQTDALIKKDCPPYDITNLYNAIGGYDFIPLEKSIVDIYDQYFRVNSASSA
jgi:NADPH-dependent methylglyoxal reductase